METILKNVFKSYVSIENKNFCELKKHLAKSSDPFDPYHVIDSYKFRPHSEWSYLKTHYDEKTFVENFGNPCFGVTRVIYTVVLEKNENKISLKVFSNVKSRSVGQIFFNKGTSVHFLTFNSKTGNLYSGHVVNHHKKRKFQKKLRCNCFYNSPVNTFFLKLKTDISRYFNKDSEIVLSSLVINYYKKFAELLGIDPIQYQRLDEELFKRNLQKKGFKLSDNFDKFIRIFPLPTKKESIKNEGKFIDTILDRLKLNGRRFKKIFHELKSFNEYSFRNFTSIFGLDFFKNLPDSYVIKILDSKSESPFSFATQHIEISSSSELLNNSNFIECVKLSIDNEINYNTLLDHVRFYQRLKYLEPTKWKAKDTNTFNNEHIEYSERIDYYSTGIFERIYDSEFVKEIQKTLLDEYHPIVLTDTKTYIEESTHQSNCVRTYIKNPNSMIISLRKDDGKDRATIEYRLNKVRNKFFLNRVQTLGRFNKKLTEDWDKVLSKLDEKVNNFLQKNEFILPKITITLKNGVKHENVLNFSENNDPYWETGENGINIMNIHNQSEVFLNF
jgi:hypothetical protein